MKRIVFSATADRQLIERGSWWRQHRDKLDLFDEEIQVARV